MQLVEAQHKNTSVTATDVRAELERILQSPQFARRPQLQRFLNFVVEEELAGRGAKLKEYVLGVGVFGRPADFDPRLDSLVRVEARRLRANLEEYYRQEGREDPVRIELQRGSYLPLFRGTGNADSDIVPSVPGHAHRKIPEVIARLTRIRKITLFATLALVAAGTFTFLQFRHAQRLSERDSIVLSEFSNSTGEPVFDETLKQGLTMALEQSPFLSVLTDRQVGQLLKLMGRSPGAHVNGDLAREVCLRSGSKAVVTGSIGRLGNKYVIGLTATNCATGDAITHLQTEAGSKKTVLTALATASAKMREKLGESLTSIQRFDVPLEEVTTPSLEALQALGLGRRTAREKGSPADIPYYKLAIELDPHFAVAYAALGVSYVNLGQPSMAIGYVRKAYELRERTSEHEKYRISAYYYQVVTGELDKSIETYELWTQNYPRDFSPHINLGLGYTWMGQYEKCIAETAEALILEPDNVLAYSNLAANYIKSGRFKDAEDILSKAKSRNLTSKFLLSNIYFLAFVRDDTATMSRQLAETKGRPGEEDPILSYQSDTEAYFGRLRRARELSQLAADSANRAKASEAAAGWLVNSALREAEFGNATIARKEVARSLSLSKGRDVLVLAALALARSGDLDGAQRIAQNLERDFAANTVIRAYWLPTIYAAIELRRYNPKRAIQFLQTASPYEMGSPPPIGLATLYPVYLRGEAFLQERHGEAAAREFAKILEHPGLVLNFPLRALAFRAMGRARASLRDSAGARQAYADFFALWKDADIDIPVLQEAKAEYAKVQ